MQSLTEGRGLRPASRVSGGSGDRRREGAREHGDGGRGTGEVERAAVRDDGFSCG